MKNNLKSLIFLSIFCLFYSAGKIMAQGKNTYPPPVEYNATSKSPTLPLVQTPPPQDSPNSVTVGVPPYYYYYPVVVGPGYEAPAYYGSQTGAPYPPRNRRTQRSFWNNTNAPGQGPYYYGAPPPYGPGNNYLYLP